MGKRERERERESGEKERKRERERTGKHQKEEKGNPSLIVVKLKRGKESNRRLVMSE